MKVIDSEIGEEGLARQLVNDGFGDILIKVCKEEVYSVKSILMKGNKTFKTLINENKASKILDLSDRCDVETFLIIEKYYSGGYIEINNKNVCKILSMCIYYNEMRLFELCKKYLKRHLNEEIIMNLFEIKHSIDRNNILDLKELCKDYIEINGFKFISKNELLYRLLSDDINLILNIYKISENEETYITRRLIQWYNNNSKNDNNNNNDDSEFEERYVNFMMKIINFYKVDWEVFSQDFIDLISEINNNEINSNLDLIKDKENESLLSSIEEISDKSIREIIIKYYKNELIKLEENEVKILKDIINIKESINMLLINDDIKLNEIGIIMIIDIKLDIKIYHSTKIKLIKKLVNEYKNNNSNNKTIIKCLSVFMNDNYLIKIIDELFNNNHQILFELLKHKKLISKENRKKLRNYIKQLNLSKEELNEYKNMMKKGKKLSYFYYPKSDYCFISRELFLIKPIYDGSKCKFSLFPKFNNSYNNKMSINEKNGIIEGYIKNEMEKKEFIIYCIDKNTKNKNNKMKFILNIEVKEIKFLHKNKSKNIKINKTGNTIRNISNYWNHCWLNIKLENGIYKVKMKFTKINKEKSGIMLGLSNENEYNGKNIFNNKNICCYYDWNGKSGNVINHIGKIVNENPNIYNDENVCIYEMIINMKIGEYSIKHNNESEILLVNELKSPLFVFVCLSGINNIIELLNVTHEE